MPRGKKGGLAMNSANAIPEGIDTFENETETNFADKEVNDTSSEKPLKKGRGRPKKEAKTEVHSNGEADQNGVEEFLKNDTDEVSDKNSSKPSSEEDKNSNQESENEDIGSDPSIEEKPQKKKGGRQKKEKKASNKTDDLNSNENNTGEGSEKNDDPETNGDENTVEEDETEAMPKKKGGRNAKKTGRGRKPAPHKEEKANENEENENLEEEETEVMPKKRGGKNTKKTGRGRKPASSKEDEANENQSDECEEQLPSIPEEEETDEEVVAKPPKAARGRGRKPAAAAVQAKPRAKKNLSPEPEKEKTKGRKRKTPPTETVDEAIYKKLNAADIEEAKNVKVSLLRQQDIDDMALNLMKSDEGKVKAAAGTSGKGRGRKRAAESEDSASKKGKATTSKAAPKREKIPDVNALDFDNKSTNAKGKSWNLKIATWNVNGLRAWLEKDGLTYLTHEDPDILCIQETKCSEEKIPPESNPVGYHCYWVAGDKEGYSGVGLMSKQKPLSVEYGIRKKVHDGEGRVITAEYEEYYLVATYVPNAGRKLVRLDYRQQWDVDFRAYLKKLDKTKPVVLCGDLNVAHNEIDLANPKTNKKNAGFTQEERDGFSSLLSEGFIDAFRHLYPDTTGAYTFWTYMSGARAKNVGWRLDYFVLSERITENLCDCVIRKDVMGSDHCPLVLFLRI